MGHSALGHCGNIGDRNLQKETAQKIKPTIILLLVKGEVTIASKLSVVLSVVFVVSLMLASAIPFAAASSFFYRTYGGMGEAYCVVQTSDGGYAIIGIMGSISAGDAIGWLVKTDSDGNIEWDKTYDEGSMGSILQASDGGYTIAGSTSSFGAGRSDFWLVKTDSSGNMEWNHTYGGPKDDYACSIVQTNDGGYAIAGDTNSYGFGYTDFWLVKTDSSGNMEWNQTHGYGNANSVIETSDGGYAMAGNAWGNPESPSFCLVKTDEAGIIPEFSSWTPILLTFVVLVVVLVLYRKEITSKSTST